MTEKEVNSKSQKTAPKSLNWERIGRWSMALFLFSVMGAGAAWGVVTLSDPNVLPLKVVRIDGEFRHLDRATLERAVGREVRGNFFTVDVDRVRHAAEELAWVDTSSVRRVWPDTLIMTVTEQQPLARWEADRLVNVRGEVFAPEVDSIPAGLPAFAGPDEDAKWVVKRFAEIRELIRPLSLTIAKLSVDKRGSWQMSLGDQLALKLGKADVDERLKRFIRIYPELNRDEQRRAKLVDLRYTNGLAVEWEIIQTELEQQVRNDRSTSGSGKGVRNGKGQV